MLENPEGIIEWREVHSSDDHKLNDAVVVHIIYCIRKVKEMTFSQARNYLAKNETQCKREKNIEQKRTN